MLAGESIPTLGRVPGTDPGAYLDQSLARIANRAIRHSCHQIATDGSQKLPQRLVNPAAERLARGGPSPRLAIAIAAWMAYLVRASDRFGRQWPATIPRPAASPPSPTTPATTPRRSSPASSPSTPSSPRARRRTRAFRAAARPRPRGAALRPIRCARQ